MPPLNRPAAVGAAVTNLASSARRCATCSPPNSLHVDAAVGAARQSAGTAAAATAAGCMPFLPCDSPAQGHPLAPR